MPDPKRSKADKEKEFIDGIEQVIGASLMPWQRDILLKFRDAHVSGRRVTINGRMHEIHYG